MIRSLSHDALHALSTATAAVRPATKRNDSAASSVKRKRHKTTSHDFAAAVRARLDDEHDASSLTDEELREIYDDGEVERFLALFRAHVTEVALPPVKGSSRQFGRTLTIVGDDIQELSVVEHSATTPDWQQDPLPGDPKQVPAHESDDDDDDWVHMDIGLGESVEDMMLISPARSMAELIASYLPDRRRPPSSPFRLTSLRVAVQRTYMATFPIYEPVLRSLWHLATWRKPWRSTTFCLLHFTLWYYEAIHTAFIAYLTTVMLCRSQIPYPTASELRQLLRLSERSERVGEAFERFSALSWLDVAPALAIGDWGMGDLFKALRNMCKAKGERLKTRVEEVIHELSETTSDRKQGESEKDAGRRIREEMKRRKEEESLRARAVFVVEAIADVHERVRNIFLWRSRAVSARYFCGLFAVLLCCLAIPARVLLSAFFLLVWLAFWFVTPVLAAMKSQELARVPPLFGDAPTDAERAIELIAERASRSESLLPDRHKWRRRRGRNRNAGVHTPDTGSPPPGSDAEELDEAKRVRRTPTQVSSQGGRFEHTLAKSAAWTNGAVRRVLYGEDDPDEHGLSRGIFSKHAEVSNATSTHMCRRGKTPMVVTINPDALSLIPLGRSDGIQTFALSHIRGVRKLQGIADGLELRCAIPGASSDFSEVEEIQLKWVTKRDELFARLVGLGTKGKG